MNQRVNPFEGTLKDIPQFKIKPQPAAPVAKDDVDRVADDTGFVSRQPSPTPKALKQPRRKSRTFRTGRNVQFNAKVTAATFERFYKVADERAAALGRPVVLGEILEQGLDALEVLGPLQKLAEREGLSLRDIIGRAVQALG